jgi:peptidoglycan L-alanyl-D-glutamate endopeptidase CwlK
MSRPLNREDILFRQRLLSCSGFYAGALDGLWGPVTDAADAAFLAKSAEIADAEGRFDARSERNIATLQSDAQRAARRSLGRIRASGADARIISGTRTYAEQQALFRQGRFGNPGPRVTNAQAGQSWHNFGLAWDIGLFEGGRYLTGAASYLEVADLGKIEDVEWGGDWRSFQDPPHYQFGTKDRSVADARRAFEAGCR